jgi:hypothetical protein
MGEPSASNTDKLRDQIQRFRGRLRSSFPFISGVLAAFLALFLYNFLFHGTQPLTEEQVNIKVNVKRLLLRRPILPRSIR